MNVTAKIYPRDYTTFVNSMKNVYFASNFI